jgi:hypothetical protein
MLISIWNYNKIKTIRDRHIEPTRIGVFPLSSAQTINHNTIERMVLKLRAKIKALKLEDSSF